MHPFIRPRCCTRRNVDLFVTILLLIFASALTSQPDCKDVRNMNECLMWAQQGVCVSNPMFMLLNCANTCKMCDLLDPGVRCQRSTLKMSIEPSYRPGNISGLFNYLSESCQVYDVKMLSKAPWVMEFKNFVSEDEIEALLTAVGEGWTRSTARGSGVNELGERERVVSTDRTSSYSWCNTPVCESNPHVQNILKKIEDVVNIPRNNFEAIQVLKYEEGQRYVPHFDMDADQSFSPSGPRIFTFFLYLSDVDAGGETYFPRIGTSIAPLKGSAVLWANVLDSDVEAQDTMTLHEARPVLKGVKLAANVWIRLYDFAIPQQWHCTNVRIHTRGQRVPVPAPLDP